eukprot:7376551-Lingulodinium_polyedra.AAC.1
MLLACCLGAPWVLLGRRFGDACTLLGRSLRAASARARALRAHATKLARARSDVQKRAAAAAD